MTSDDLNFDGISEADLAALIRDGARREIALEIQPLVYDNHFRREVSSFANSRGGHLLIGIAEKNGVATGFAPLSGGPREELARLDQLLREGITPPVAGVRMKAVSLAAGGFVVVVHIPKSREPPHRVRHPRDPRGTVVYTRDSRGPLELHPRAVDERFG
jgi:predicted HTH transcriptional regulator